MSAGQRMGCANMPCTRRGGSGLLNIGDVQRRTAHRRPSRLRPSRHAGDGCVSARCRRTTRRPADLAMESYGTPPNGWRPGAGSGCPLVQVPVYCGAQVHGETPPQEGGVGRSTGPGMASSLSWIQQRGTGSCSSPISEWQHHPGKVTVDRQRMNGANRPCTRRPWRWITPPTALCRVGSAHRRHR